MNKEIEVKQAIEKAFGGLKVKINSYNVESIIEDINEKNFSDINIYLMDSNEMIEYDIDCELNDFNGEIKVNTKNININKWNEKEEDHNIKISYNKLIELEKEI